MRTLVLDGLFVYKDLPAVFELRRSIDIIFEKAKKNSIDRFILIQNGNIKNVPEGIKNIILKDFCVKDILETIDEESKNSDEVIVFNAASPFYDPEFCAKMLETHSKYIADYTYTVGYPDGAVPAIIRKDIIKELIPLVENEKELKKDYLFYAISKDINSFDIETLLSEEDLRIYRISLGLSDRGEEIFTENLYKILKNEFSVEKLSSYLSVNINKLFSALYMMTFELTDFSDVSSIYYPQAGKAKNELDFNIIKKALEYLKVSNGKASVIFGGIGEPFLHSRFIEIVQFVLENGFTLIIETTLSKPIDDFIKKDFDKNKIVFVVKQDAYYENTYKIIHPEGDFNGLLEKTKKLKESGFKVYRQAVRINENEVELEKFVRNKETDDLIIRKFSTYCGLLPDKKVVDLSPLERIPCFHLRRELFIKSDGKVPLCSYSAFTDTALADAGKENFNDIVKKLEAEYINNADKEYRDFCKNCDDYYIFNF